MEEAHYFFECLHKINTAFQDVENHIDSIALGKDITRL